MDPALKDRLIALAQNDLAVRERLAAEGSLFEGYHPRMRAVHEQNAAGLAEIIAQIGWPTPDLVGEDGAEAAWLIVQHAIGLPAFQRRCLKALQAEALAGTVPAWQPAKLLDRVRALEGRPQVYGTNFDWDDEGRMSPTPIEDPAGIDERRSAVGLAPLADAIAHHRAGAAHEHRPKDLAERRRQMEVWARQVGWR